MAESTHWYRKDGTPAYTVIGANGQERGTTLRDARKEGLLPSVTSIIRLAAAPALEKWKREQLLLAGLTLPRISGEVESEWLRRVEQDSQEQGKKAAERGVAIHAAIEQHFRGQVPDHDYFPWVQKAKEALRDCLPEGDKWRAEHCFASPLGYGGRCDLHSPEWVIDVKSKDGPRADVYDEHLMQLGACRYGVKLPNARCGILFVDRLTPGAKLVEVDPADAERGLEMFQALLTFYRAKSGHRP